jgi:hypothetical protein
MRFMITVKASKESEAGVMPEEKLLNTNGETGCGNQASLTW